METSTLNSMIQGGSGLVGGLTGGIFGMIEGKKNREFQEQMQQNQIEAARASQERQHQLNEISANNADKRSRELFKDFQTAEARRRMLEEAGLSVGLMYNGAAGSTIGNVGGGAQAAGTGMANPAGAGSNPYNASGWVNAGVGAGLALAQSRLMESEANKNNAEADRLKGEGPRGEAELNNINAVIQNTLADTKNKAAETELKKSANAPHECRSGTNRTKNRDRKQDTSGYNQKYGTAK